MVAWRRDEQEERVEEAVVKAVMGRKFGATCKKAGIAFPSDLFAES